MGSGTFLEQFRAAQLLTVDERALPEAFPKVRAKLAQAAVSVQAGTEEF